VSRRKADGFGVASGLRLSRMLEVAVGVAGQEQVGMQHIVGLLLQIASVGMGWAEVYWMMEST
jgi:hypothetical protein